MNGAPRETAPNSDNLDAVLGRFQGWMATQRVNPAAAKSKTQTKTTGATLPRDAHEVSYEQALRASSYRRPTDPSNDVAPVPASSSMPANPESVVFADTPPRSKEALPVVPDVKQAFVAATRPARTPWPEARFTAAARASASQTSPPTKVAATKEPAAAAPPKTNRRAAKASKAAAAPAKQNPAIKVPEASMPPRKPQRVQPAFRDVLEGTASLAAATRNVSAAKTDTDVAERGKTSALTLRVSDQEQARIQACAAQAGLSLSAYLRQCALGVDELRSQVETALIRLHDQKSNVALTPASLPAKLPGISAIPGILGRFAKQCLRRLRGGSSEMTSISIR